MIGSIHPTNSSVHAIRVEFISRLYFMQMYHPQKVSQMIQTQAGVVAHGVNRLEINLQNLPADQTFNRLAVELRIKLLHSVTKWLKDCSAALVEGQSRGEVDE